MMRRIHTVKNVKISDKDASRIGREVFYGTRRARNRRKAMPYLLQAANAGYTHSQNLVGYCYSQGSGVKKNLRLSFFWFKAAAAGNHKEALFNLGLSYEMGMG